MLIQTAHDTFSIDNYFSSATWVQREIFDMFGIRFLGRFKTDLRRILTDYGFKGHPMRRDYVVIGYKEKLFSLIKKRVLSKSML